MVTTVRRRHLRRTRNGATEVRTHSMIRKEPVYVKRGGKLSKSKFVVVTKPKEETTIAARDPSTGEVRGRAVKKGGRFIILK